MEIKGQKMLKVIGILLIIFGAIGLVGSIISVSGMSAINALAAEYELGNIPMLLTVSTILAVVYAAIELVAGIVGVKAAGTPSVGKIKLSLILALVILVLAIASIIMSIMASNEMVSIIGTGTGIASTIISIVTGLVMPVLYLVSVFRYKNALVALMGGDAE